MLCRFKLRWFIFFFCLMALFLPGAQARAQVARCLDGDRLLKITNPFMKGDDVWELQKRLHDLGFYQGPCDGVYGYRTADAVAKFHSQYHLNPTPMVTEATWEALARGCTHQVHTTRRPQLPISLLVDLEKRSLSVMEGDRVFCSFPVAVGKPKTPSPVGDWKITDKSSGWGGGFGDRWMGLNVPWGIYGIHGTNKPWSIGESVSAGCIRMYNEDIIQLYKWVPVGTRVCITGPPHWATAKWERLLRKGDCGPHVVYVQMSLKSLGFYPYHCDSWYGSLTGLAVSSFQLTNGLPVTGQVDEITYHKLQQASGLAPAPDPGPD